MLRKGNFLYGTNRGTFYIALTRRVRLSTVLWSWAIIKETGLMGLRIALLLWVALAGSAAEGGERALPEVGPTVSAVVPLGGQRGASTEIRIRGKNLDGISEIRFARPGINAELLESSFYQAKARVTVGAQVPTGLHDFRLTTARGGHVGVFHVGSLPQQDENEPNGEIAEAQSVSTPVLIDGVADEGDYDVFRFWAEAGETVVADVMARRAGGSLDATLALLDHRGNELDFVDDYYIFKDPHLSFTAKRAGEYLIRVAGSQEQGSPDSSYRLVLGSVPVMQRVLPLGGRRGETTEFEIHGINVDRITRIVLDDSVAIGDVIEASPGRLRFRMSVPPDVTVGRRQLRAEAESFEAPLPLPILLSDVEERISSAPRKRAAPQEVRLPVAITGVLDSRRAAEFFSFEVEAGERVEFDVHSMRLDYPLDPALFLYNAEGQQLAYQDEPAPNSGKEQPNLDPYLVYDFEESGRYVVMIRDSSQRGHPNNAYRMLVRRVAPDFQLRALTPTHTLFRGETNLLPLRVRRLGGWVRPVEIWLDNPPPGIQAAKVVAEPKNTPYKGTCGEDLWIDGTNVDLLLEVAADAPLGSYPIRLRARGETAGRVVEHKADVIYRWGSVGKIKGPTARQELLVTVTDLPPVVIETPETFSLLPGKTSRLKVIAARFDDVRTPLKLELDSLPPGITLSNNIVAPGANQTEIMLTLSDQVKTGAYPIRLQAGNVVSPPIELKISTGEDP